MSAAHLSSSDSAPTVSAWPAWCCSAGAGPEARPGNQVRVWHADQGNGNGIGGEDGMGQADTQQTSVAAPPSATSRRPSRRVRLLAAAIGWGCLLMAAVPLLAVADGGRRNLAVILVAALAAWATLPAVLAPLVLAAARLWRSAAAALVVLLVVLISLRPWPHGNGDPGRDAVPLTVVGQNMLFGQADAEELVARVRAARADVVVLTELTPEALARVDTAGLGRLLPYRVVQPRPWAGGTGLFSRTPLSQGRSVDGTAFEAVEALTDLDGRRIRLVGAHPVPPLQPRWQADHARLEQRYRPLLAAGEQVVVAGDFNATTGNQPFRGLLGAGFLDAGAARLWAWQGQTWPTDQGPFPVLRIDHVLAPQGSAVDRVETYRITGSDHAGLVVRLRLAR